MHERVLVTQRALYPMALFVSLLFICTVIPTIASAQQSTLKQQLLEPDCSIQNACEMLPPTITSLDKNGNKPIIRGTYDTAFSRQLRVIFGERVYTLGVDEQLTAQGDLWELDLSTLSAPLVAGAYELIVETEGYDGEIKQAKLITTISPAEQALEQHTGTATPHQELPAGADGESGSVIEPVPEAIPQPMSPEEARTKVSLVPIVATAVAVVLLFAVGAVLSWQKFKD